MTNGNTTWQLIQQLCPLTDEPRDDKYLALKDGLEVMLWLEDGQVLMHEGDELTEDLIQQLKQKGLVL